MAVIDLSSHASWPLRVRARRVARPLEQKPSFGRLPLGSFAQGRPLQRALLECAGSTLALVGAVVAMLLLGAG